LEFLYGYPDLRDREVIGLMASSLAYGRVLQILKSVSLVLEKMGASPFLFLMDTPKKEFFRIFADFKHRFTTGRELADLLVGTRNVIDRYGSLYDAFIRGLDHEGDTILPAMTGFVERLRKGMSQEKNSLLPSPEKGSACKRLNLFMRWMVRRDAVDPGGWETVPPEMLIVPLDTHMHRICRQLRLTSRRQANMRTAIEVTWAFRKFTPADPVRYDFSLTRLGIRDDTCLEEFIRGVKGGGMA
jgi:uncharacterized protein (TIGR02757 family)